MRKITITKNDSGQRLDKFLSKKFKTMPKSLMYKYIRTKYIKLNGKKTSPEVFLNDGDELTLYIKDEFFGEKKSYEFLKASSSLDILYEDEQMILLDKKPGVIVHQDKNFDTDTLNLRVLRYLYEKGEYHPDEENAFTPALCNRIDRNTGGIVIAAKTAEALRVINQKIRDREIEKYYLCLVKGVPKPAHKILKDYLIKNENTNTVRVLHEKRDDAKEIITEYTVLKTKDNLSLCEILLHTGRTHQIRAHMASIGHPLIGDEKYGDRKLNDKLSIKRQQLYAYKLRFDFKTDAGSLVYLDQKEFEVKTVPFNNEEFGMKK